jgi:hypothetical protein
MFIAFLISIFSRVKYSFDFLDYILSQFERLFSRNVDPEFFSFKGEAVKLKELDQKLATRKIFNIYLACQLVCFIDTFSFSFVKVKDVDLLKVLWSHEYHICSSSKFKLIVLNLILD